ncbi:aldehyde dehydrogenase family protein [Micromonospora olivasterospora]|uniref:Aldehyde dehydrogenase (NAD+) n=1 Tax=Micromonospora olivasterospora TaxID=1880 RepID=A0A562IIS5_MICOL|nr:aldehyde dehydrogenase family protein [Micromonospora olivasterospora]TWH70716.1 aldehyde dehydrogenase (NAD+) [Micromonospora olivasterospora]
MTAPLLHWIGGEAVPPTTGNFRSGTNPATGGAGAQVAQGTAADVDLAVRAAHAAAPGWRRIASLERGRILAAIGRRLLADLDALAELESLDTGKPLALATAEIRGAAEYFEFYAALVNLPAGDVLDIQPDLHVYTLREPFGVVGVITPWNLPLNQAARACAPALAAGNTIVAKPAETTSQTTVTLARIASEEGLPPGVFNVVLGRGDEVGTAIVRHPLVRKVAFTGSVRVGQDIGRIAADRILPLTLELGGKSANIVFADADLEFAAAEAVRAFTTNAGQVCSSGTRLLVERSVQERLVEALVAAARRLRPGQDVGPMITRGQYDTVQRYFAIAAEEGARTELGGAVVSDPELDGGFYVEPTIYSGVTNEMRIAREEIFGPVLVVIPFDTEQEAIALANDSEFGLVGGVFTEDISRAFRVAESIEAGQVYINSWSTQSVQMPFGGHKQSGYGREKGIEALHHYSHVKSVSVRLAPRR